MTHEHALLIIRITSALTANGFHDARLCPSLSFAAGIASTEAEGVAVKAICLSERLPRVGDVMVGCQLGFSSDGLNVVGV